MKTTNFKTMRGFTAIEYVAIVAAIAIATIAVVSASSGFFGSSKKNSAILEVSKLVNAAKLYRISNNNYASITVEEMSDNGYDIEPFTNGTGENAYGADASMAPTNANTQAVLLYTTDEDSACASLKARYGESADGVASAFCIAASANSGGSATSTGPRLILTIN